MIVDDMILLDKLIDCIKEFIENNSVTKDKLELVTYVINQFEGEYIESNS